MSGQLPEDAGIERLLILSNAELYGLNMRTMGESGGDEERLILVKVTGLWTQRGQSMRDAPTRSLEFVVAPKAARELAALLTAAAIRWGEA